MYLSITASSTPTVDTKYPSDHTASVPQYTFFKYGNFCFSSLAVFYFIIPTAFPTGIVFGGLVITKGLGFRFITDKKGFPNPIGINGNIEGDCPPYKSTDQAVDEIIKTKWGPGGIFTPEASPTPFLDQASLAKGIEKSTEDVIKCTKSVCNYIYNKYGRFPGTTDTMSIPLIVVVHHLDTDFYKKFYKPGAITENLDNHMVKWHSF